MGDRDFVKPLLEKRGKLHFDKVVPCFQLSLLVEIRKDANIMQPGSWMQSLYDIEQEQHNIEISLSNALVVQCLSIWHNNLCSSLFQVFLKPGKPFVFAEISFGSTENKILAFGLPGNPVSSLVCFHLFVVPAIRNLAGWTNPHHLRSHNFPKFMLVQMTLRQ